MKKELENNLENKKAKIENETKREHFLRLVNTRMSKADARILSIAKMVRNTQYDVNEKDIDIMEKSLMLAVDGIRKSYGLRGRYNLSETKKYIE